MKRITPESGVLKACMDYLAAERIPAWRMNSGMARMGARFIRFGEKGMADIIAFPVRRYRAQATPKTLNAWADIATVMPLWIECKAGRGKQSEEQISFASYVTERGMKYVVAKDVEDLKDFLLRHLG